MRSSQFLKKRKYIAKILVIIVDNLFCVNNFIVAESEHEANFLASKFFGSSNVLSITEISNSFNESTETLDSDQLKIKSLQDQQKKPTEKMDSVHEKLALYLHQRRETGCNMYFCNFSFFPSKKDIYPFDINFDLGDSSSVLFGFLIFANCGTSIESERSTDSTRGI